LINRKADQSPVPCVRSEHRHPAGYGGAIDDLLPTAVPVVDVVVPSSSPRPTLPLMHAMVTHGTPRALLVCASDLLHHLHSCMKDVGAHWDHRHDEHVSLCIFFMTRCMSAVAYVNVLRLRSLPAVAHGSLKTASPDPASLFLIAAPLLPPPNPSRCSSECDVYLHDPAVRCALILTLT